MRRNARWNCYNTPYCSSYIHVFINPIHTGEGGGGLLRPALTLKMYNFRRIKTITTTNLATFPKNLLGILQHLYHVIHDFDVSMATSFWTAMFFKIRILINIISMVYGVIFVFSLSLETIYQIRYILAYIMPISVRYLF